ncbi:exopolysaccharide transport family protein [Beijerinckia sp. L45]|uniref:GumC family protein n=1 Tax=Beijerinckia sp. L45 TaxID=1641855 RepID=UPI00131ECC07|nr:exopolysaccharide transport family protein [Beijerinckia sp. L45]
MSLRETQEHSQDLERLDLGEVKRFLARRWMLILGTALVAVILALVACVSMTPIYTAMSQVLLDPSKQRVFGQESVTPDVALDSAVVDSQIPIILSTRTLSYVVSHEHLTEDPEFAQATKPGMIGRLLALFAPPRVANVEPPSLDGIDPKLAPVISRLFEHVDVARIAKSNVLSITVSSRDSHKAALLANAMAQAYVADQVDVHVRSIQQAATFFEDRLGALRDQVRLSEQAVADFRKKSGLATTSDEKVTVSEQQLTDLNERLATASSDTAEKLAKYQQAQHFKSGGGDLDTLSEVVRSPVINQLRTQQADVTRREADLAVTYGSAYPAMAQIRAQRQGLNVAIAAEMKRLVSTLKNDYEVAKAREDSLRKTMAAIGNLSGGENDVGVKLRELERTNLANKALFENFLNRAKLTQEQSTFEAPDARLISPALEPAAPSSPKTKLILPVAGVAGLLLGLGLAAVLDLLRNRVQQAPLDPGRSNGRGEVPILGYVPVMDTSDRGGRGAAGAAGFMATPPRSDFTRGIEDVAARLAALGGARVVLLAPLVAGEGSSTLAQRLATLLGASGKRVLLIDADDGRRTLSIGLSLSSHPGLSDVLHGTAPIAAAVVPQEVFAFLPVGQTPFDPAARAVKRRLRALLQEARGRFDIVLVDGAAVHEGGNTMAWAGLVDALALVAGWEQLLLPRFVPTVDAVTALPRFAGLILNRTSPPTAAESLALAS